MVAKYIADVKGDKLETVVDKVTSNFCKLYSIEKPQYRMDPY